MRRGSITFTVEGKGEFPIDMLRHDQCYPVDAEAVEGIDHVKHIRLGTTTNGRLKRVKRQVNLVGYSCTPGRWESFGWKVAS